MGLTDEIKSYASIRRHTTPEAFVAAMAFISWHNRLTFTHMLEPWQGLLVAMACEARPVEGLQFQTIKNWLEQRTEPPPENEIECREASAQLLSHLFPTN